MERVQVIRPTDVLSVVKRYRNCRQENFLAITLSSDHYVIKVHHISKGLLNKAIVHPRECYYPAIKDNAAAIVFAHNHPSGEVKPSQEDLEITKRLCAAGKILGFHVLDHIIFTKSEKYKSLREHGVIYEDQYENDNLEKYIAELSYDEEG